MKTSKVFGWDKVGDISLLMNHLPGEVLKNSLYSRYGRYNDVQRHRKCSQILMGGYKLITWYDQRHPEVYETSALDENPASHLAF